MKEQTVGMLTLCGMLLAWVVVRLDGWWVVSKGQVKEAA